MMLGHMAAQGRFVLFITFKKILEVFVNKYKIYNQIGKAIAVALFINGQQ